MRKAFVVVVGMMGMAVLLTTYTLSLLGEASSNNGSGGNSPPKLVLLYPKGGESLSGEVDIRWLAQDPDNDPIVVKIQYTSDPPPFCPSCPPQSWQDIADGIQNTGSYTWNTATIPDGKYIVRIVASDGVSETSKDTGWIYVSNE